MPKVQKDKPDTLRPYIFHGVDLQWRDGDKDALADCPMCGRADKFGVEIATGKYHCFPCDAGGGKRKFLDWLHAESERKNTSRIEDFHSETMVHYQDLVRNRGLQAPDILIHWGICKSSITGDWLVPGYNVDDELNQLYRYVTTAKGRRLLATPTLGHQLFGVPPLHNIDKPVVFICEGPWDAMVLWETLREAKREDCNVLGVPGCSTFSKAWLPLFADRTVNLMYDNDHPRKHPKTGKTIAPAALHGMRRVARMLMASSEPPLEVNFLRWGKKGYDLDRPSGFDVRDFLNAHQPHGQEPGHYPP